MTAAARLLAQLVSLYSTNTLFDPLHLWEGPPPWRGVYTHLLAAVPAVATVACRGACRGRLLPLECPSVDGGCTVLARVTFAQVCWHLCVRCRQGMPTPSFAARLHACWAACLQQSERERSGLVPQEVPVLVGSSRQHGTACTTRVLVWVRADSQVGRLVRTGWLARESRGRQRCWFAFDTAVHRAGVACAP